MPSTFGLRPSAFGRLLVVICVMLVLAAPAAAQISFKSGKTWDGPGPKDQGPDLKTDRSEYEHALAVYQAGDTSKAVSLCNQVIATYKSGEWVERAALLKARVCFKKGDLKKADRELTLVRKRYPCTAIAREVSDLQFAIGAAYVDRGKYAGVKILEEMVESNPYGPRADEAQFKIGEYYFRKGENVSAAESFALLIAQYKDSRYREDAMFLRAKATYLENEGPKRDPLPYEEARVGLNEYLGDYPRGRHVEEAQALLAKIETALARKHYLIAEYYRGQGCRRAAQRYYRYVVEKFPNSTWAAKARKRLPKEKPPPAVEIPTEPKPPETPPPPRAEPTAPETPPEVTEPPQPETGDVSPEAEPAPDTPTETKPVEEKGETE